jgi:hypothetical protein
MPSPDRVHDQAPGRQLLRIHPGGAPASCMGGARWKRSRPSSGAGQSFRCRLRRCGDQPHAPLHLARNL